jgi:hypothetical protein
LDYFKVDIVNTETAGPDQGVQVPYRPPVPPLGTFAHQITVAQDAMVDSEYPDLNFSHWHSQDESERINLLTVNSTQFVIMRWDLSKFAGRIVAGSGVLELTTHSLQRSSDYPKDFGMVRVVEILGGDPQWNRKEVTFHKLCQGQSMQQVLNSQMIIDIEVAPRRGDKNLVTISNPVLQRMLEGKTLGLALRPLGAVHASFYAKENQVEELGPKLHMNVVSN